MLTHRGRSSQPTQAGHPLTHSKKRWDAAQAVGLGQVALAAAMRDPCLAIARKPCETSNSESHSCEFSVMAQSSHPVTSHESDYKRSALLRELSMGRLQEPAER